MSETKKCPKCSGEMRIGYLSSASHWSEGTSLWARPKSRAFAYACRNCGYVEFYLEQKPNPRKEQTIPIENSGRDRLVRS